LQKCIYPGKLQFMEHSKLEMVVLEDDVVSSVWTTHQHG